MRPSLGIALIGLCAAGWPAPASAQVVPRPSLQPRVDYSSRAYAAPGFYGTTYGTASYGLTRTYSSFASPYGLGYGSGLAPYRALPGPYGMGLWRPGVVAPGYAYYGTFPVYPETPALVPGIGAYAPGYGPPPIGLP